MADRKGRSVTFKVPRALNLRELKTGLEDGITSEIVVFQDFDLLTRRYGALSTHH